MPIRELCPSEGLSESDVCDRNQCPSEGPSESDMSDRDSV